MDSENIKPLSTSGIPTDHSVILSRGPPEVPALRVVGIGSSAGGLDAIRKLLDVLPSPNDLAFVYVLHLDPTHASMMVDLLTSHTEMTVVEGRDGVAVAANTVYVIPPGCSLGVAEGCLHLSIPLEPHGSRLPIDFLFNSLAAAYGKNCACIILSGTGADGSVGALAIHAAGGLVIAQDPEEADYGGMPRSAIAMGVVNRVLAIADMPSALDHFLTTISAPVEDNDPSALILKQIIDLIRAKTVHDFTQYKPGTLRRRIERRMAMANLAPSNLGEYLKRLIADPAELDLLATYLLINVTYFFRDPAIFTVLSEQVIPEIVRQNAASGAPIRVWIAGCSSGEEAFSLAMLFRERLTLEKVDIKLQLFASDVDPDAIAQAREGLFPLSISQQVSAERLERFFLKDENGYRVSLELRSLVVFTVQDVLVDPPFSRLDMISCRNMLIYLGPEAQTKVIGLFHFALNKGGILLLGPAETIGEVKDRFEIIDKVSRLYRHVGPQSRLDMGLAGSFDLGRQPGRIAGALSPPKSLSLSDLARQGILDAFGPATVIVNRKGACVFSLGAVNNFLTVPAGVPTQDLFALTDPALHPKLRLAIQRATDEDNRITISAGRVARAGGTFALAISAEPIINDGVKLTLISFVETPYDERGTLTEKSIHGPDRSDDLQVELASVKADLAEAVRSLRISSEQQKQINEEALSVNEEYQSTNEELLASKEELQSVNEELTALNTQLQETLDRQRTTSNDLQNVLYSTDVATLFLDLSLKIRFFTPSTQSLFNVIPGDVGRPLADLHVFAVDDTFLSDAVTVLAKHLPAEREVQARSGVWYVRRILPYRTNTDTVEGVVVTFSDVSERHRVAEALETAKRRAQQADAAKSRFLAAASHDLRQPLQALALLQGLLAQTVVGEKALRLVTRLDDTLASMTGMLNTLLDINQIEAGTLSAEIIQFPVNALLNRMRDEFTDLAMSQGLVLRVVPSSLEIVSDPILIEQMVRNILSNGLKYTKTGKILLGCRRRGRHTCIELWDSGLGIPEGELQSIFEEYHQIGNVARERVNGLGLGLAIVKRLGTMLGHNVSVRSWLGKGSAFTIETRSPKVRQGKFKIEPYATPTPATEISVAHGSILVIEDEPDIRLLLEALLTADGHHVMTAGDGIEALDMITRNLVRPDMILADFNLPCGINGLQLAAKARHILHRAVPVIILTGDISTETLANIKASHCLYLSKPVKLTELRLAVQRKLTNGEIMSHKLIEQLSLPDKEPPGPVVYIVDDDDSLRLGLRELLEASHYRVEDFASCEAFNIAYHPGREACLLIDALLPGMSGLDLLHEIRAQGHNLPAIMITGNGDVAVAVDGMKAGAIDFLEKPVGAKALVASVERALAAASQGQSRAVGHDAAVAQLAGLTPRQHQIMDMILAGHPNKNIAADLHISQRTVENHRAAIMKRTGSTSLPDLARIAVAADDGRAPSCVGCVGDPAARIKC